MKTKVCSKCKKRKSIKQYNFKIKAKNIRQSACKLCTRKEYTTHYNIIDNKKRIVKKIGIRNEKFHQKFLEFKKTFSCKLCPEKEPCCLEFHHLNPKQKDFNLSHHRNYGWKRILKEIKKCVCLCSNCHKKVHAGILKV